MLVRAEKNMFSSDHFVNFQPILGPLAMSAILGAGAGRGEGGSERGKVGERVSVFVCRSGRKRDRGERGREGGRGHRHTGTGTGTDPGVHSIVAAIQRSKTEIVTGFSHERARGVDECTQQGEVACVLCLGLGFRP